MNKYEQDQLCNEAVAKMEEKQIEERTCYNCNHYCACEEVARIHGSSWVNYIFNNSDIAKRCEHYQPELPEDSVVLSREEAERFRGQTVNIANVKTQERKETARQFIHKLEQLQRCLKQVALNEFILSARKEYGIDLDQDDKCKYFKEIDYGYRTSKQCYAQKCAPECTCQGYKSRCEKYPKIKE